MKQTRSALTMLLSAYRSILSRAFFKGLAVAAALGAAAVPAADLSASGDIISQSAADTISGNGTASSLTVSSGHKISVEEGEVGIVGGSISINGEVAIAEDAALWLSRGNTVDFDALGLQTVSDLVPYAEDVGSGTISIADGGELNLENGYYNLSNLTVANSGVITVDDDAVLITTDGDSLMNMGQVVISEYDEGGYIILTADNASISQDLFSSDHLSADRSGGLYTNKLTITASSLNTYGIELMSDDDAFLTVDADSTFTLYGEDTQLGVRMGDLTLIDASGNATDGTLLISDGAGVYFEDWVTPEAEHTIGADIELSGGSWLDFDDGGVWNAQKLTAGAGSSVAIGDYEGDNPAVTVNFTDVALSSSNLTIWSDSTLAVSSSLEVGDNASLSIRSNASLDLNFGNTVDFDALGLQTVSDLVPYAADLGSGTISIADGGELNLENGYYNLSNLTVANSGVITVDDDAVLITTDGDSLMNMGQVVISEYDEGGYIILTADNASISQDLFSSDHLSADRSGGLYTNKLTITASSLNTYGIELMSDDDAFLTVDADGTFTLYGQDTQLGVRMGDLTLIDASGNTTDGTLLISDGAGVYFEDWVDPEAEHTIGADIEMDDGWLEFDDGGIWNAQKLTASAGNIIIGDSEGENPDVTVNFTDVSLSGSQSELTVYANGTLNAENFSLLNSAAADIDGTLAVSSSLVVDANASLTVGTAGTLDLGDAAQTVGLGVDADSFTTADSYNSSAVCVNGSIDVDLSNVDLGEDGLTTALADSLFTALQSGGTGLVNISGQDLNPGTSEDESESEAESSVLTYTEDLQYLTWSTETTRETTVVEVSGPISGGWNALILSEDSAVAEVTADYTLCLFGSTSSGNIVESADGSTAGVTIADGGSLLLQGSGDIGTISGESGSLTVSSGAAVNVVSEDDSAAAIAVDQLIVADASVSVADGTVTASAAELQEGASLSAATVSTAELTLQGAELTADEVSASGTLSVSSSTLTASTLSLTEEAAVASQSTVTVADTLTTGSMTVSGSSQVTAGTINVLADSLVQVGVESTDDVEGSSGTLEAGTLNLNGSTLLLDPDFGLPVALAAAGSFGGELTVAEDDSESSDLQTLDGSVVVGQNAALGVGMTLAELQQAVASYLSGGSLVEGSDYASLAVINSSGLAISSGSNLVMSGTASSDDLLDTLTSLQDADSSGIYLGEGSSLIFTSSSLVSGDDEYTIQLADSDGQLTAAGGQVVVPVLISQTQFDNLITTADGSAVVSGGDLEVTTANGLFSGTIAEGESFSASALESTLTADTSVLSGTSSAMQNYVLAVASDVWDGSMSVDLSDAGTAFFSEAISGSSASALETASRLAVFGGAVQAAYLADQQAAGAIAARAGFNAGMNLTVAEGSGFGLWLAPVYGYVDASGFDANGLDAGAEISLYGVSLGVDYAFADTVKAGVMFSLGQGDADGSDAGSAVDNDFDYYSVGLYADITPVEDLAVLAHLTYTEVDNDLDAYSGLSDFGMLSASADSSALSAGIEGMYTLHAGMVDIAPHLGLRYTHLELDDYQVSSARGVILSTDNDELDIFSIPVGVKFSADIKSGDWKVSPAVDLHASFNFGDDELDSRVSFAGISRSAALSTEVIDSVTYGVAVGVSASCSAFNMGLQLGYEGSENTDAFTAMLNAGYAF